MEGIRVLARAQNTNDDPKVFSSAGVAVGTAVMAVKTDTVNGIKGRLYSLSVLSKTATAYWLMAFDSKAAPVNTAVPLFRVQVPTSAQQMNQPEWASLFGVAFAQGMWLALSSTADTLTLAVANDAHVFAEYM